MLLSLAALATLVGAATDAAAQRGVASFYANRFAGRTMADGTPMDPHGDNAASRTLPLGTRARVTNLQTGQSALVTIRDRGPYVKGRIVDLSPATARLVGITPKAGLAKVEVTPVTQLAAETRAAPWN
jgi:rare lipoprotein A